MTVVELFSGNADITQALNNKGVTCVSVDYDASKKPMLCCDVYKLTDDFLGRCKMPSRLIDDICNAVGIALYGKENKQ